VDIVGSLFLLLCCSAAFFIFLLAKLPGPASEFPPAMRYMMLGMQGLMICLSLFGVATGIGLIYLRKWVRISILIWGGLSVFFGIVGMPFAFLLPLSPGSNAPELPAAGMTAVRSILLLVYAVPFAIGVWWLILFNRKSIKAQFAGQGESSDQGLPRKPACPLPIAVLAWFYVTSVLNLLFLPLLSFHVPLFVFGRVLPGSTGGAVLMLSSLAYAIARIGLFKAQAVELLADDRPSVILAC
jgi:hypothetical protein